MPADTPAPKYGDRVRVKCTATGRYLRDGLALVVSASSNDLFVDTLHKVQDPHPTLPVPSDDALEGASAAMSYVARERAVEAARAVSRG